MDGRPAEASYDRATNTYAVELPALEPAGCVRVAITHPICLIHDNSDCRERIVNRLTRAQNTQAEKQLLLQKADEALERLRRGEAIRDHWFAADTSPALDGYMKEMISQLGG